MIFFFTAEATTLYLTVTKGCEERQLEKIHLSKATAP